MSSYLKENRHQLSMAAALLIASTCQVSVANAQDISCSSSGYSSIADDSHDAFSAQETTDRPEICNDIAISRALADPDLVGDEEAGLRLNFATAGNEEFTAIGISGSHVLARNLFGDQGRLTGSAAIAFSGDQRGARAGLQLSW